jgi:TonB family protein
VEAAANPDIAIYSSEDDDVQPPVLLSAQVPLPIIIGGDGGTNTVEFIVSASGSVERVRLVDGPRRMPDMMFLSGAKMWKFRPAERNGQPVRYKTSVSWVSVP